MSERSKKDRIKEKRKAALEARLAKVKQRRKLKTGDQEAEEGIYIYLNAKVSQLNTSTVFFNMVRMRTFS